MPFSLDQVYLREMRVKSSAQSVRRGSFSSGHGSASDRTHSTYTKVLSTLSPYMFHEQECYGRRIPLTRRTHRFVGKIEPALRLARPLLVIRADVFLDYHQN